MITTFQTTQKPLIWFSLMGLLIIACTLLPNSARAQEAILIDGNEVVANEVIIKFKSNSRVSQYFTLLQRGAPNAEHVLGDLKVHADVAASISRHGVDRLYTAHVEQDLEQALAELNADPRVEYAEPNYIVHADEIPDDTNYGILWGLDNTGQSSGTADADIDARETWDITTDGSGIVVGVIDTGIDYTHPDLASNIWTNPGEIDGNNIDDDGNGYIDDIHGWDWVNNDNDPMDDNSHGTHVAGTIGAIGNNSEGVVGVSWTAHIAALKFLDASGSG